MTKIRPWLFVIAGFVAIIVAYICIFRAVRVAQIQEVPLATKGGRP